MTKWIQRLCEFLICCVNVRHHYQSLSVVIYPCHSLTNDGFIFNFSIEFIGGNFGLQTMQVSNMCTLHPAFIAKAVSFPIFLPLAHFHLAPFLLAIITLIVSMCYVYVFFFSIFEIDNHFKLPSNSFGYKDKGKPFQSPIWLDVTFLFGVIFYYLKIYSGGFRK